MRIVWAIAIGVVMAQPAPVCGAPVPQSGSAAQAQSGGVQASQPKFHVIRSISGSEGAQQSGTYVIRDPRTVFYVPEDHKVIVYFEWEGPVGPHHFEGVWKSPDGKTTSISNFDYDAKQNKFGGFWEMLIAESTPMGLWGLEARVDGEVTGTHAFQILAGKTPVSTEPKRFVLSSAELYQRATAATVSIASLNSQGVPLNHGLGFFIDKGTILTAFQVIDGAVTIRVTLPSGKQVETQELAGWNRRQDWAIVKVSTDVDAQLTFAKPNSAVVGDRCYVLDSDSTGNRVIGSTSIVGASNIPGAGQRLTLSSAFSRDGIGAALLNEYGEVIAVVGGNLVPGIISTEALHSSFSSGFLGTGDSRRGGLATPVTEISIPARGAKGATLGELAASGQFLPPIVEYDDIISGTMAREIRRENGVPIPVDDKFQFARREGHAALVLTLEPKKKRKGTTTLAIYDLDSRLIAQTTPSKSELASGKLMFLTWQLDISRLAPALYRLDVLIDGSPIWRTFFRVTD
jgi:hypothetical protein